MARKGGTLWPKNVKPHLVKPDLVKPDLKPEDELKNKRAGRHPLLVFCGCRDS